MPQNTRFTFNVRRRSPELIGPAKPTPRELKPLSDIDDQEAFRYHIPVIHFYPSHPKMRNKNPASLIREALAKLLVFYYPFAGRLKEFPSRKLMVDCTGEGVLFIEAEADVTLKQFGDKLHPPFPCLEQLLYEVPGSEGVLNSPLLLIQVTRLLCGGFIFAIRLNHTMSDAPGLVQFMTALTEMVKGASAPSTLPVWQRELLFARDPPRVTCSHLVYEEVKGVKGTIFQPNNMAFRSFFFGRAEMSALRRFVPTSLQNSTTFEVVTACLWRCRTIALQPDPEEEMRIVCIVNARAKFNPPLPLGYYGNAFAFSVGVSTARDLATKPFSHALKQVIKAKSDVNEEYMRSNADLMVIKGRPPTIAVRSFVVSDVSRTGLDAIDFGWGKAAYGGPAKTNIRGTSCFYVGVTNHKGEFGTLVPMCLPNTAMEIFEREVNNMLVQDKNDQVLQKHKLPKFSKL